MGKKSRESKRKPRSTSLYLDMGKPVALNHFTIGKNGSITVGSANGEEHPVASHIITAYDRDNKGPKIINRLIESPKNLTIVPDRTLKRYNWVMAVDTNKPEKRLPDIVFTGVVYSKVRPRSRGRLSLNIYQENVIEFHNLYLPSERFGWLYAIRSVSPRQGERVAVIVDHDLGRIPYLNRRDEPIQEGFYLPTNFELLYASSDTGDRHIANDLLKICDKNSRNVAKLVASGLAPPSPPLRGSVFGEPFKYIRIWNIPQDLPQNKDQR